MKIHVHTEKHFEEYLRCLAHCSKPSERWESRLIARRADPSRVQNIRFLPPKDKLFSLSSLLAVLTDYPLLSRPIIVLSNTFWLVKNSASWSRVVPTRFLDELRRIVAVQVSQYPCWDWEPWGFAAVRWTCSRTQPSDLRSIKVFSALAIQDELATEPEATMQAMIATLAASRP